jgi:endogenous inhibitor of DNA gyrase (YacG/DUF329 family)
LQSVVAIKVKKVRCPQCGRESLWSTENKYRPFCSERCKLIDLGAWASEVYRVPVREETLELDDDFPSKAE